MFWVQAAWDLAFEFKEPVCAIIKHTNPCGTATGKNLAEAYVRALECDPVSAFGGVVAFNREEVEKSGESHELHDRAALERALAHPWNVWVYFMDHDIAVLAARLYTSIGTAGAFAAGNKRTAFRAAAAFVEANGYVLDLPPQRHPLDRLLGYFDGRLGQSGVVEWFRLWLTHG